MENGDNGLRWKYETIRSSPDQNRKEGSGTLRNKLEYFNLMKLNANDKTGGGLLANLMQGAMAKTEPVPPSVPKFEIQSTDLESKDHGKMRHALLCTYAAQDRDVSWWSEKDNQGKRSPGNIFVGTDTPDGEFITFKVPANPWRQALKKHGVLEKAVAIHPVLPEDEIMNRVVYGTYGDSSFLK